MNWQRTPLDSSVKTVETRRDYTNYPQSCQVDTFRFLAQKLGGKRLGYPIIRSSKLVFQPSPRSIRGKSSRRRPGLGLSPAFSESGCFPRYLMSYMTGRDVVQVPLSSVHSSIVVNKGGNATFTILNISSSSIIGYLAGWRTLNNLGPIRRGYRRSKLVEWW